MQTSDKGINFIINEEGEKLIAYKCPAGIWTIGVGHTGKDVKEGMKITKEQSREFLKKDIAWAEKVVNDTITVNLSQNQFDALVSFTFNTGPNALPTSTLAKKINAGASVSSIISEWKKWKYGGGKVLSVLIKRRERETKLFKGEL